MIKSKKRSKPANKVLRNMSQHDIILEISFYVQHKLARACLDKKRLTLDETFSLVSAVSNISTYLMKK